MNAIAEKSLTSDWQMILIPPLFFFFQFTSEDSTLGKEAKRQTHEAFVKYQCQQVFFLAGNLSYITTPSSRVIKIKSKLALRRGSHSVCSAHDFQKRILEQKGELLTMGKCCRKLWPKSTEYDGEFWQKCPMRVWREMPHTESWSIRSFKNQ